MKEHMEEHMKPKPWLITKMMLFYRTAAPLDYFILTFQKASPKSWLRSSKGSGGSCFATDLMNHEPITYASMLLSIKLNHFPNSSNRKIIMSFHCQDKEMYIFLTNDASWKFPWWDVLSVLYTGYKSISRSESEPINTVHEDFFSLIHREYWVCHKMPSSRQLRTSS